MVYMLNKIEANLHISGAVGVVNKKNGRDICRSLNKMPGFFKIPGWFLATIVDFRIYSRLISKFRTNSCFPGHVGALYIT